MNDPSPLDLPSSPAMMLDVLPARARLRRQRLRTATRFIAETSGEVLRTPLPGIQPASTVFFDSVEALQQGEAAPFEGFFYGSMGTPTVRLLEAAIARLEGGERAVAVATGNAAIAAAFLTFTRTGGHVLVVDTANSGTRRLCEDTLRGSGVEVEYYHPARGAALKALIRPSTSVVYMESPGSLSFELQDVPAIAAVARARGVVSILDNTWGGLGLFPAFDHGVDVSLLSIGKQGGGHSDFVLGAVVARDQHARMVKDTSVRLGQVPGSLETYLALRGLRTLPLRGERQERTALALAEWFSGRSDVRRVLHPALPKCPGSWLWQRDFAGAGGLFTVAFHAARRAEVLRALDRLTLTRLGFGWGGTESLALPCLSPPPRAHAPQPEEEFWVRISAGLEDVDDLIEDWQMALAMR